MLHIRLMDWPPMSHMDSLKFIDWLKAYQDFPFDLPRRASRIIRYIDAETDEVLSETAPPFLAEGSYCTSFRIQVCGRRLIVDGNPSRINRLDNVFGLTSISECMQVINGILIELGLPCMTRCVSSLRRNDGSIIPDGAVLLRLDVTSNAYVGKGNERAYIRGISSQRFRHSIGYLYPDGNTVVWTPTGGEKAGRLMYPGIYNKAAEMDAHLLRKVKKVFSEDSDEYRYVKSLRDWCASVGMVRYEIKLRSELLKDKNLCYWGLFDEENLWGLLGEFLKVGDKMSIDNYDVVTIADELIARGICSSRQAAGSTASYAFNWMAGATFDFNKSAVKTHRAKLRQIGIDIKLPHDSTRHGVVFLRNVREVELSFHQPMPGFYRPAVVPSHLRLVA